MEFSQAPLGLGAVTFDMEHIVFLLIFSPILFALLTGIRRDFAAIGALAGLLAVMLSGL